MLQCKFTSDGSGIPKNLKPGRAFEKKIIELGKVLVLKVKKIPFIFPHNPQIPISSTRSVTKLLIKGHRIFYKNVEISQKKIVLTNHKPIPFSSEKLTVEVALFLVLFILMAPYKLLVSGKK